MTPLRATYAVALFAALALAISQFMDYRGVAVGSGDYAVYPGIETVAPAPQVDRRATGSAHAYLLLPVALGALGALALAPRGRPGLARLAAALGALAVVVALAVDVPAGLDEGSTLVAYEGARASLLEGFWVELWAAVVLAFAGLLVAREAERP